MDFTHLAAAPSSWAATEADALLVVVVGDTLDESLDPVIAGLLADATQHGDFKREAGKSFFIHRPATVKARRVVFAASGTATIKAVRAAFTQGLAQLKAAGVVQVAVGVSGAELDPTDVAQHLAISAAEAAYLYRRTKPSAPPAVAWRRISLLAPKAQGKAIKAGFATGAAIAAGVTQAREWANAPGNVCTPSFLAQEAKALGKEFGLKVEVLEQAALEKLGMGAFLAVAKGSREAPKFIVARYQGAAKSQAPVVLVGKGITFDSGGISIKPAAEMDEMKFDMGGAASVFGALRTIAELKPALNLVVLVPACENLPDGLAVKPGDVVTSMSGQTIEILNTDAEGRLILCDALTYAERFKPAVVIDVATLTGACVVALGGHRSGLFSPDDALAAELHAAGERALDLCWRMPLDDEYQEGLKSNFADVANVAGRDGGAITAATFLKRFTTKYRWAHLDIAGSAWKKGPSKGATGRPVALLVHYLLAVASQ